MCPLLCVKNCAECRSEGDRRAGRSLPLWNWQSTEKQHGARKRAPYKGFTSCGKCLESKNLNVCIENTWKAHPFDRWWPRLSEKVSL